MRSCTLHVRNLTKKRSGSFLLYEAEALDNYAIVSKKRAPGLLSTAFMYDGYAKERNWLDAAGDFWIDMSRDADECNLDYYDVRVTPEVIAARQAFGRGAVKGAIAATYPLRHPIDTLEGIVVTTWDGVNEITNMAGMYYSEGSRRRGEARGRAVFNSYDGFRNADHLGKIEAATEFASTLLFGYGAGHVAKLGAVKVYDVARPVVARKAAEYSVGFALNGEPIVNGWNGLRPNGNLGRDIVKIEAKSRFRLKFKQGEELRHYLKHNVEFKEKFGLITYTLEEYIQDAISVIRDGVFVPELNGYVKIPVGVGKNCASQLVGLDRLTGEITTYHMKRISILEGKAPSLGWMSKPKHEGIDLIGPEQHLGYKPPYRKPKL